MADAKRDANRVPTIIGVSNADGITPTKIYVDPATGRMLVSAEVISTVSDAIADGDAVDVATQGILILGTDGSNYQALLTDSDGRLQIDITTSAAIAITNADITTVAGAVSGGHMQVDVLSTTGNVAVTNADLTTLAGGVSGGHYQVDVLSIPAVTATDLDVRDLDETQDAVSVKLATDKIMNDKTALTPKFAVIDVASSGDNTILAAVVDKKIRVLSLYLVASSAVTARFESGAAGTALSGQMQLASNGGFVLPFNPVGWFETAVNTLLNLELSGAISVDGGLVYVEV